MNITKPIAIFIVMLLLPISPILAYQLFIYDLIIDLSISVSNLPGFILVILFALLWAYPFFRLYKLAFAFNRSVALIYAGLGISLLVTCVMTNVLENLSEQLVEPPTGWVRAMSVSFTSVLMFILAELMTRIYVKKPRSNLGRQAKTQGISTMTVLVTVSYTVTTFYFFEGSGLYLWASFVLAFCFGFSLKFKFESSILGIPKIISSGSGGCLGIVVFYYFYVGLSSNFMDAWLLNVYTFDFIYSLTPVSYLALDTAGSVPQGIYLVEGAIGIFTVFILITFVGPVFAYFWHALVNTPIDEFLLMTHNMIRKE